MMDEPKTKPNSTRRSLHVLAMVNVGIWAISMVALVFLIQKSPAAKGMFPILAGGSAVGVAMITTIAKIPLDK